MNLDDLVGHLNDDDDRAAHIAAMLSEARRRVRRHEEAEPRIVREEKRCPRCDEVKPVSEFGVVRSRPDGRHWYCRACR